MAIITLGGNLGAGKTTLAEQLVSVFHYDQLYIGGIFRKLAAERGVSIEQFYKELAADPQLESEVDRQQEKLMKERDNIIIQGRVAWYFAKASPFKVVNVCLLVDPLVGAQRSGERPENAGKSIQEILTANTLREKDEQQRYRNLYGIENYADPKHYDIVLDTSKLNKEEVLETIVREVRKKIAMVGAENGAHK